MVETLRSQHEQSVQAAESEKAALMELITKSQAQVKQLQRTLERERTNARKRVEAQVQRKSMTL